MNKKFVGSNIKNKLKEIGMNQTHLAKKLGISPQQLNNIFNRGKTSKYLYKIAEIIGISETELEWGVNEIIRLVQILEDVDLISLLNKDDPVRIDELMTTVLSSYPQILKHDTWHFGYQLKYDVNAQICKGDVMFFSSFMPLCDKMAGNIVISLITRKNEIVIGKVKLNADDRRIICNNLNVYNLTEDDYILGVATSLNRNIGGL